MPTAVIPVVIGEASGRTLVEATITFPEPVLLAEPARNVVEVQRCTPVSGSVIVVGRVVRDIPFKTSVRSASGTGGSSVTCGDLRHCTALIPFQLLISVPNAQDGDQCRILIACIAGEIVQPLFNPDGQEVILEVCVRVQVTRLETVDLVGATRPTTNFITFPNP
jgi:hypothetical protein